jgi:hypothetical protein
MNAPSKELVEKHYLVISNIILKTSYEESLPVENVIERTVNMFGLIRVPGEINKYQLVPELKKIADEAEAKTGQGLPPYFSGDEAILFCAAQTALLESEGKLGEVAMKINEAILKAETQGKQPPGPVSEDTEDGKVIQLRGKKPGPTFH